MSDLHVITLNVQGLNDKNKRFRLYEWIKNKKCNIIFQETHFTEKIKTTVSNEISQIRDIFHSFGSSNGRGVSTLIKSNFEYYVLKNISIDDGRNLY